MNSKVGMIHYTVTVNTNPSHCHHSHFEDILQALIIKDSFPIIL